MTEDPSSDSQNPDENPDSHGCAYNSGIQEAETVPGSKVTS